jgi:hypothetical protein
MNIFYQVFFNYVHNFYTNVWDDCFFGIVHTKRYITKMKCYLVRIYYERKRRILGDNI